MTIAPIPFLFNDLRVLGREVASKHGCAILTLRHTNKNEGASASMRGGGSTAFRNATRAGLAFGPDHNDGTGEGRIMATEPFPWQET